MDKFKAFNDSRAKKQKLEKKNQKKERNYFF
jgi:hypothetical protein